MRISNNIENLKVTGIENLVREILEDFPAFSKSRVQMFLNAKKFAVRETKTSLQKIRISKSHSGICNSCFHSKISGKYNVLERSGTLFSYLIYSKLTAIDLTSINIKTLKAGDCFNLHLYLVSDYVKENKTKKIDKNSANINSLSHLEHTVWKRLTVLDTISVSREHAESTYLISYPQIQIRPISGIIYLHQKQNFDTIYGYSAAKIYEKRIFQKVLKLSDEEKKPLKRIESGITYRDPKSFKIASKNKDAVIMHDKYKLKNKGANFHLVPLFPSYSEDFMISEEFEMFTPNIRNSLNHPEKLRGLCITSRNFDFLESVKSHYLKPNFPAWELNSGQKSEIHISYMDETEKVVPSISQEVAETVFLQKNINMEHLGSFNKDRVPYGVEVWNPGNFIGNTQDLVLRQSAKNIPKESSRYTEENVPGYVSKQNIRSLSEKISFSTVSPRDINAIVDKVYRLLETKLLVEKERRGLR